MARHEGNGTGVCCMGGGAVAGLREDFWRAIRRHSVSLSVPVGDDITRWLEGSLLYHEVVGRIFDFREVVERNLDLSRGGFIYHEVEV